MAALEAIDHWPVPVVAAGVLTAGEIGDRRGPTDHRFRIASLAKMMTSWAVLVACEEGIVHLDQPVGQPGCTLRHLLAHCGGYPFDGDTPIAAPATRRIYSNVGIELAADTVGAAANMPFATYASEAVFAPLQMASTTMPGSPAAGVWSSVDDLLRFVGEVRAPQLISRATAADACAVQFPGLPGVLPGVRSYAVNDWGLGFEIKGAKTDHWMGAATSERTVGHFGGAGTMAWWDPAVDVAVVALTDRIFDEWAAEALTSWASVSDAVVAEYAR